MAERSIEKEVITFVAEESGIDGRKIFPQTTIFGDLGLDGDEGVELILAFSQYFSVDIQFCQMERHFGPEGLPIWAPFYWLVLFLRYLLEPGSTPESRARLLPITIQDLIDSAKGERWTFSYQ